MFMSESSTETGAVNYDGTPSFNKVQEFEQKTEDLSKLTSADIRPEVPEPGGTDLVLQVMPVMIEPIKVLQNSVLLLQKVLSKYLRMQGVFLMQFSTILVQKKEVRLT